MAFLSNISITLLAAWLLVRIAAGPLREYAVLFLYALVDLTSSVAEETVLRSSGRGGPVYINLYWTNELLLDLLLFVLVVVLIQRIAEQPALRSAVGKILLVVIGASAILPFAYGHHLLRSLQGHTVFSSRWFSVAGQVLNFGGAIMNLVLWTALLASKRRDPRILAVSAGLGLIVTGVTFNYGIVILTSLSSVGFRSFGVTMASIAHVAGLAIWCWAFRPSANRLQVAANEKTS